jgi:shikimate dehydrogenase
LPLVTAMLGLPQDLESVLHGLGSVPNVRGLLITMPHKNTMFACCATFSKTANLLSAASVARRNADGSWHGDMLDGVSFVAAQKKEGARPEGARILQIGAGGAASAIAIALLDAGVRDLILHDANRSRLEEMVRLLFSLGGGRVVVGRRTRPDAIWW